MLGLACGARGSAHVERFVRLEYPIMTFAKASSVAVVFMTFACSGHSTDHEVPNGVPTGTGGAPSTTSSEDPVVPTELDNQIVLPVVEDVIDPGTMAPALPAKHPVLEVWDLSAALPVGSKLVGVSRDPEANELFVLEESTGIYRVNEDRSIELVFSPGDITPEDGREPQGLFSDFVALGQDRFALTVPNEGYMLDVPNQLMWRHFCYLPNYESALDPTETSISVQFQLDGHEVWQGTDSLTLEVATGLLWATPRTFLTETDELVGSELASFDYATGEPQQWWRFNRADFHAGAMAISDAYYYFAMDDSIQVVERVENSFTETISFSGNGFETISGLHRQESGTMLITTKESLIVSLVDPEANELGVR